jgi:hypothetical protein
MGATKKDLLALVQQMGMAVLSFVPLRSLFNVRGRCRDDRAHVCRVEPGSTNRPPSPRACGSASTH